MVGVWKEKKSRGKKVVSVGKKIRGFVEEQQRTAFRPNLPEINLKSLIHRMESVTEVSLIGESWKKEREEKGEGEGGEEVLLNLQ